MWSLRVMYHVNMLESYFKRSQMIFLACKVGEGEQAVCVGERAVWRETLFRKEYPPNIQKIDTDVSRLSQLHEIQSMMENTEESGSESESGIMRKGLEQSNYATVCSCNGKASENQTKCQRCGSLCFKVLPRHSMQSIALNDSLGPLVREPILSSDCVMRRDTGTVLRSNGRVGSKIAGNLRQKSSVTSELNDPIVLSSDDEEEDGIGSTSRLESISPRPADSACSSPAPSTGKVEAALKENTCGIEQRLTSITADTEPAVTLPRKARMKDQFGSVVVNGASKTCLRVTTQETSQSYHSADVSLKYPNSCESVILNCRSIRIGTLRRMVVEPVIFCLDFLLRYRLRRIRNWVLGDINLKPSPELTNSISDFFVKIPFEEANSRLVAFTKSFEDTSKGNAHKEGKTKQVVSESKMQLRNAAQFQFFDDDECGEPHTVFIGPIEKLIVYPPPPAKGGISVTNEDLHCLNEGEFLNDVIIDFYLKYLVLEKLKKENADRIHIFSSFFYKRLNQRERRNLHEISKLTIQQKRHGRVKTWTRHVDIFEKDFIFVPLNEAAHWFLAVICYPGLETPVYEPNPYYQEHMPTQIKSSSSDQDRSTSPVTPSDLDTLQHTSSAAVAAKKVLNRKQSDTLADTGTEGEDNEFLHCRQHLCGRSGLKQLNQLTSTKDELRTLEPAVHTCDHQSLEANGMQSGPKAQIQASDGLQKIRLNYSEDSADSSKLNEDELIDFSDDQDNQENSSDDDGLADDNCNSELGQWHLKPTICKQPCILLMDSLRGPSRSNVVRTLREYLEVEWEVKKGTKKSFSKDVMKGSNPKVPQQNNFSDCGVYVLQYVESFFEDPIRSFELPMNLTDWFPRPRMKTKREEIRNIILNLHEQQNKEKKGQKDPNSTEKSFQEGNFCYEFRLIELNSNF
uniref:Uncharacterized protein n=1 Tax=Sphaerodactylus townsendi TaxID=933632 RepID=A0ACB8GEI9_9SAUR